MASVEHVRGSLHDGPKGMRRAAWLIPDLALVAAGVTLFYCLFLFQGYRQLFRDSDAGWHIRTGESILQTRHLPHTDPYSFSRAGEPWMDWEWLSDVAAGAAHRAGGLSGVALLYGAIIAAGVWLWFRLHWILHGNFLLAAAMAPLLLTTCSLHWMARPHVIGWLFLVTAILLAESYRPPLRTPHLILAAVFGALWANVHASFFLAPLLALIYAAGSLLRPLVWNVDRAASWTRARWFACVALILMVAPLANPYGAALYTHVFRYLFDSELLARIGEFQSFDFHTSGSLQIAAALLLGAGGGFLALLRKRPEHFLLSLLFTGLALRSARGLPLAALVLLPLANRAITEHLDLAGGLHPPFRAALDRFLRYSANLRSLDMARSQAPGLSFRGLAWLPVLLLACWGLLRLPSVAAATGFPPDQFPVAAYAHLPQSGRLFASDKFGGYLIYRSAGTRQVFFDGRSDFYGARFLKDYGRLIQARPGWQSWWNSFGFTHALLSPDAPLLAALEQAGWVRIYSDKTAVLVALDGT